jgi:hypothetical protein
MLRHTFVFLAFSLTITAAQAGTPTDTGSAAQANVKRPAEQVKTSAAVKQAPKPVEVKKSEPKVTAEPKAAKTPDAKAPAAANAKPPETKPAASAKTAVIKAAPAPNAKTTAIKPAPSAKTAEEKKENDKAKTVKSEGGVKEIGRAEHVREQRLIRAGLVPPPPPETPAVLSAPDGSSGFYMMQGFMPVETLSPDALRARQKQLTSQLQNVKDILKDRQSRLSDKTDRAKQFDGLYQEGVISRRELEASQEDIKTAKRDFDDAKSRVDDIQMALNRVDEKLKTIAKYGSHSNKRFAAADKKRSKSKSANVSAQAVQTSGTKTALKPATVHQIDGSAAQPAPSADSSEATGIQPTAVSTDSASAAPVRVADPASQPAPESQADTSSQLAPPGPAQAAR